MTQHYDPARLAAMSRAARLIAAYRADDSHGITAAVTEAKSEDGGVLLMALAAAVLAADLAEKVHGPDAQVQLDGRALDAMFFEERELNRQADDE